MELTEAKNVLGRVTGVIPTAQWTRELATAVQRALGEPHLLNPDDDVDGAIGSRTRSAWAFFKEATDQPDATASLRKARVG